MLENIIYEYNNNTAFMYYILTFVCVIGLIFGSFLNVVALRFLSGESIVLPPSKCPNCNTKLKWYDNIPVLAYILLLGKCRYCKKPISIQYPIVEALTGLMFVSVFLKYGFTFATPMLWLLFCNGIVMCITDFRKQIIFDIISMPLIPIGLVYSFFNLGNISYSDINIFNLSFTLKSTFIDAIIGIVIAFLFFEIISLFSKIIIKQRAFGEGDTIIAMIFASWFGWKIMLVTVILGVIVQALFTLPLMIAKLVKLQDKQAIIAFSTLIICAIIPIALKNTQIFNNQIINLLLIVLILGMAIVSSMIFLRRMRELNAYTLLPFGPALIVAGFISSMYLNSYLPLLFG